LRAFVQRLARDIEAFVAARRYMAGKMNHEPNIYGV
jgi:hypothetical protein